MNDHIPLALFFVVLLAWLAALANNVGFDQNGDELDRYGPGWEATCGLFSE